MKKLLALFLALLMLIPMLVACQDATDKPGETTVGDDGTKEPSETTAPWDHGIPKTDYKEREFYISVPLSGDMWGELSYDREEDNGDAIESAIYKRNREVEDFFNITIKVEGHGPTDSQAPAFQSFALAGSDVIDMIAVGFYQSGKPFIVNDYVLPWNNVENINLSRDYWNDSVTKTLSILGQNYYIVGDVNWFTMSEVSVCYFNKQVAKNLESKIGNLYEAVEDNKWTFDTALAAATQAKSENGDGKWDELDTYGAIQNTIIGVTGFLYAANYKTVIMSDNGPQFNIQTEKMNNIISYIVGFCNDNNVSYTETFDYAHQSKGIDIFFDNRALFYFDILMHAQSFRDRENDFGILPYPKYDDKQKDYVSYANQWGLACALPCTASDTARTGAILEVLSAKSLEYIVPAYYEKTLMGKIKRDDESEAMLDIIFSNILYDFGICYCTDLSYIFPKSLVEGNNKSVSSVYRRVEKKFKANYNELYWHVYEKVNGTPHPDAT